MYHVELDISQAQKEQLKLAAYRDGQTIVQYCTEAVLEKLEPNEEKKEENET